MKKRLLGILLSFAMMLTMMPMLTLTAYAESDVYIGDTHVTGTATGQGWEYNDSTQTLTLTNYDNNGVIHKWGDYDSYSAGIYANHDLNIEFSGTNRINNPTTNSSGAYGIYVNGNCTIKGSGTLDAQGYYGIYAESDMTVNGGTVNATSTHAGGIGICTNSNSGGITINDGALTAIGGDIGIAAYFGTSGNVIVNGGTVTATGNNGIMADYVTIKGGTVNVTASGGHTYGIYSYNNISIEGGTVTAINRGDQGTGIYCSNGVTIGEGSTVTAVGSGCGIGNMVKNAIVGIGWTDVDGTTGKTDIDVREQGQPLDYKAVRFPAYTVTYKVVNGTWSDGKTADIEESVASGMKPASVPTGMKASEGYTGGSWDKNPAETTITGATTFTYTFEAKKPAANPLTVTTTAKTSARSMTVKWTWNNVPGAKSYKVSYHKVGSKKWTTKTTKKTKYVVKGHKMKGLYEYKVAAVTASGDVWSNTSCRYFKTVKTKAKFSKGALKVSWKKDKGAAGYEVFIARNKKMDGAQVIQVAPASKSYSVTGLEKGKYYVKVRPMKNYNGVTYTGILCKAKKVKVK